MPLVALLVNALMVRFLGPEWLRKVPDAFVACCHDPSKYILTALSISFPDASHRPFNTLGFTLSPTKASKVSKSKPEGQFLASSEACRWSCAIRGLAASGL